MLLKSQSEWDRSKTILHMHSKLVVGVVSDETRRAVHRYIVASEYLLGSDACGGEVGGVGQGDERGGGEIRKQDNGKTKQGWGCDLGLLKREFT